MAVFSPGFRGRRRDPSPALPPGQYEETGFPVLSAGPTQVVRRDDWRFTLTTETGERREWTWDSLMALGAETVVTDIHCVTSWSKLGTRWRGVPVDRVLEGVETAAGYAMAGSAGGYTTNLPLSDLTGGRAWIAFEHDGAPLPAEHGGPARLLVPHRYLWKSAKWIASLTLMTEDRPGFWEGLGYHLRGDPWQEERYR